jgi:hypothetical protein
MCYINVAIWQPDYWEKINVITTLPMLVLRSCRQPRSDEPSLCSQRHHVAPPRPCAPTGPAEGGGTASSNSARGRRCVEGGGRRAPAQLGATAQREAAGELQIGSGVAAHGGRRPPASSSLAQGRRRAKGSFSYGESPSR